MNLQQVEKRVVRDDGALDVIAVFATIQGEGPFTGQPAVFVRLAGCDLQCPACDTDYTSNRRMVGPLDLIKEIKGLTRSTGTQLIVLTGGEPLRQCCGVFVGEAGYAGYDIQIETNGTLWDESLKGTMGRWVTLVCSPKTPAISEEVMRRAHHFKYILQADQVDADDGLPLSSLNLGLRPARPPKGFNGNVYVQPCDEGDEVKNKANTEAAVASCLKHGYLLCLQLHKVVGLP